MIFDTDECYEGQTQRHMEEMTMCRQFDSSLILGTHHEASE